MLKETAGSTHGPTKRLELEIWLLNTDMVWSKTLAWPWGPKKGKIKAETADRPADSLRIRIISIRAADTHIQR